MPIKRCNENGKPGYKWGNSGKCYTYTPGNEQSRKRAKRKAFLQGAAIEANSSKVWEDVEKELEIDYDVILHLMLEFETNKLEE